MPVQSLLNYRQIRIALALLLALSLLIPPLSNFFLAKAHGAFSNAKIQINNSQAGASGVTYSGYFTASASTAIEKLTIVFCTTASGTCTTPTGMVTTSAVRVSTNVSGSSPSDSFGGNGTLQTTWTESTQTPLTINYTVSGITNPTTANTTFYARITSYQDGGVTEIDTLTVALAVLSSTSIAVSATVDPNFTFTVARAVTGNTGSGSTPDVINVSSTTDSSIPFGSLNTTVASVSAHDVTITTNAASGYTVTASSSAVPPLSYGSDNIDSFSGTNAAPTTWSAPGGSSPSVNTGYFGYTTNDSTLCTGTAARFTDDTASEYAGFATLGGEVACSSTPVSSQTTRVSWKLAVNSIQPAGAYTGTIILIATPTY